MKYFSEDFGRGVNDTCAAGCFLDGAKHLNNNLNQIAAAAAATFCKHVRREHQLVWKGPLVFQTKL